MLMRCHIIILILISFFLLGCNRSPGNGSAVFRAEKGVSVHSIGGPLVLGVPVDLCAEGEYLYVLAYNQDKWLHIYDKKTGDKISEAILVGRGPGEGINLVSMDYLREERNLYLYDMVLRKTLVYHIDDKSSTATFIREIQHPTKGVIRKCHILPDDLFLYEGYLPEYGSETRFTLSDGERVIDTYSTYPGVDNEDDQMAFILGVSKVDSSTGRFVAGTTFGAVLECFDVSSEGIKPIVTRLLDLPEMDLSERSIKMKDGSKYGFSTICLSKDYIYTNYLDNSDPTVFKSIATFDWRGREQTKYTMDQNILRLCQDNKKEELFYGIASSPEMVFSLVWFTLD